MTDTRQCSKRVFSGARWDHGGHQCAKRGKMQIDGKWYCTIHTPEYEAQHDAKMRAKWAAESAAMDARFTAEEQRDADATLGALVRAALATPWSELWIEHDYGQYHVKLWRQGVDMTAGSGDTEITALTAAGITTHDQDNTG